MQSIKFIPVQHWHSQALYVELPSLLKHSVRKGFVVNNNGSHTAHDVSLKVELALEQSGE